MKIIPHRSNQTIVVHLGVSILFSYSTPVAAHIDGQGYFRTEEKHSVTTSKHINAWLAGAKAELRPQAFFNNLPTLENFTQHWTQQTKHKTHEDRK